ncbi:hypothetical protein Gasu_28420 isoform 1 [Galdieria sulphuraria]|uniref:Uncharacterized protein n=1 Tax=Galdieria sulphuraria TaxID=130081 RepID=M2XIE4_GALSU|nr:hypothetical protein Gasu_28420 isoform 1 [Galdieria sulphuraria]EME29842.1 hypothetical protein isoform 1 [Galdieria sulphuraria]|eukprot:XP_005706362.1 hypothetical protein isoform 1 [Galdieria sulphuraria]
MKQPFVSVSFLVNSQWIFSSNALLSKLNVKNKHHNLLKISRRNCCCSASLIEEFQKKLNNGQVQEAFLLFKQLPSSSFSEVKSGFQLLNVVSTLVLKRHYSNQVQVAEVYDELKKKNCLKAFSVIDSEEKLPEPSKQIGLDKLVETAKIPLEALRPRSQSIFSYQLAGVVFSLSLIFFSHLFHIENIIRPIGISLLVGFLCDQIALQGAIFEELYKNLFPIYKKKVLKHEAGHFLVSYLLGCPVRGIVLSAWESLSLGIPGQAGTLFFDRKLESELSTGFLTDATIDRYSIVLMAGIAAEALEYGQAEGGQSDEAALLRVLTCLNPPWSKERVFNQARWAVLQKGNRLFSSSRNRKRHTMLSFMHCQVKSRWGTALL